MFNSQIKSFNNILFEWYKTSGRADLPWRQTQNPYNIWISEIMLQQTQVLRVQEKFYPRFLETFPTLETFATVSWEDVYDVWEGLGYYSRGKNMLRTAKAIQENYKGIFPNSFQDLISLPGIGDYTANAILAFAFDQKVVAYDTNLNKLGLLLGDEKNLLSLVKKSKSGRIWNSAMMDLASSMRSKKEAPVEFSSFFNPEEVRLVFSPPKRVSKSLLKRAKKISKERDIPLEIISCACMYQSKKYFFERNSNFPQVLMAPKMDAREVLKKEIQKRLGFKISVRPHFFEMIQETSSRVELIRFHRCQIQAGNSILEQKNWKNLDEIQIKPEMEELFKTLKKMR